MAQRIQIRRDTAANWTSVNPILSQGEIGLETDTKQKKIGDGFTAWNSLSYDTDNTRSISTASTATLTPNIDNYDLFIITAQAAALTIANPTGTPVNGNAFIIRIKDNGTGRAISFGNKYRAIGSALPTTTTASKVLYIPVVYNFQDDKFDVLPNQEEQ